MIERERIEMEKANKWEKMEFEKAKSYETIFEIKREGEAREGHG